MSNEGAQRSRTTETPRTGRPDDTTDSNLADMRAETDRLFTAIGTSLEAMNQGSSEEFLRRSRQTGGQ